MHLDEGPSRCFSPKSKKQTGANAQCCVRNPYSLSESCNFIIKKWLVPEEGSLRFTELYHTDITPGECLPGTVQHQAANDDLGLVSAIKKQKPEPN